MRKITLIAIVASVASLSFGQAVINSGTSQFGWTSATDANISGATVRTGTGGGTSVVYSANGSADQLFQNWWWYRVNGVNAREFALSNMTSKVVSGNSMTLNYAEPEGFSTELRYTITNSAAGALVTGTAFITNTGSSALDMSFFNYMDFDMDGFGNDTATLVSDNPSMLMLIGDSTDLINVEYRALDGVAYQVGDFPSVRNLLTDANVNDLNNSGLPYGPGDFSAANQWSFVLNEGEQIAVQTSMVLNPVPEPASMAALGLGVVALLRRRKKS